jgi:ankyrin repeat protein
MSKTKKNIVAAITFFSITSALSFLSWNYEIDQVWWLNRAARLEDIRLALKNNPGNVDVKDASGLTGLMLAVELGDLERVQLLLEYKADPNIVSSDQNRGTALHMLCRKSLMLDRGIEILKLLLEYKANPNIKDAYGRTPLHWIGLIGGENDKYRTLVLDLLMKYGADLNAQDNNGDTPLNTMIDYLWSRDPRWFEVALFKPYGSKIDPTLKNKKGQNSKDYAVARRCLPIVKFLCSTGKWTCTPAQAAGAIE